MSSPPAGKWNDTLVSELKAKGKRVALVSTGGTIASRRSQSENDGVRVALSAVDLLADAQGALGVDIEPVLDVARVNSWNVDPELMWDVGRLAAKLLERSDINGVVVTHGTDTIEETAFLVDLLNDTDKPVVFTAAMRSADSLSADGPHNLYGALRAAACRDLRGIGAVVCMDDELHAARWVRKSHTYRTAAFSSPSGRVGTVDPDGVVRRICGPLPRWTLPRPLSDDVCLASVPVIQAYAGMPAVALEAMVRATAARGVVIEGFGLGHTPASLVPVMSDLMAEGVLVVVATRVAAGGTWPVYGGAGGGRDLADMGVLTAGELSAGKARLLLMSCLTTHEPDVARKLFTEAVGVLGRGQEESGT